MLQIQRQAILILTLMPAIMLVMHGEAKLSFYHGKENLPYLMCLQIILRIQWNCTNISAKIFLEECEKMTIIWVKSCALKEIPMAKLYDWTLMIILKTD